MSKVRRVGWFTAFAGLAYKAIERVRAVTAEPEKDLDTGVWSDLSL